MIITFTGNQWGERVLYKNNSCWGVMIHNISCLSFETSMKSCCKIVNICLNQLTTFKVESWLGAGGLSYTKHFSPVSLCQCATLLFSKSGNGPTDRFSRLAALALCPFLPFLWVALDPQISGTSSEWLIMLWSDWCWCCIVDDTDAVALADATGALVDDAVDADIGDGAQFQEKGG